MVVDCPNCKTENPFRIAKCTNCGYPFDQDKARDLATYEEQVRLTPERSAAWIMYAYSLMRYNRMNEALTALDRALPLLSPTDETLAEYSEAARLYALANRPDYAQRLLADGMLYNMDQFRHELDAETVNHATSALLSIADQVWTIKMKTGKGPKAVLTTGLVNQLGLGAYQLAEQLASPPNQRLYPGTMTMVSKSSGAVAKQQTSRRFVMLGAGALVFLLLFACVLSQCAAS